MTHPDTGMATAVALLVAASEVAFLDKEESHDLLETLLEGLDVDSARLVIDRLLALTWGLAREGGVDLDEWLPRMGMIAAEGFLP